jgi:hypothetical protein
MGSKAARASIVAGLVLGGLLAGCWRDSEYIDRAVWSDDGLSQAYVKLLFEESPQTHPISGTTNKRHFRHRIFVRNASGAFDALTGERPGQHGAFVYYLRQAGYVLIEVLESGGVRRVDLIRLETGRSVEVARFTPPAGSEAHCYHSDFLPSPDGHTIALIERVAAAQSTDGPGFCAGGTTTVTLRSAATLAQTAQHRWAMDDWPEAVWSNANQLFVWSTQDGSWRVDPASGPIPQAHPTCTTPRTSSSEISLAGVMIGPGAHDGEPVVVLEANARNCRATSP